MTFYIAKTIRAPFDAAIDKVTAALKEEGFGVLTDIDGSAALKKKIGVDWRPYRILGACNPPLAHRALQAEDKIGTMLPCNVIVTETAPGKVEVAAVDPVASMSAIQNPALGDIAGKVRQMMSDGLDAL